jgi:putative glutathione S-transferase
LFATLEELEERLSRQRYLVGHQITKADWRLLPTLLRFDVAYFSLFKCNKQRIADYPNLSNYMRDLYQVPGVADTVKPRYYVINYRSIAKLNRAILGALMLFAISLHTAKQVPKIATKLQR